MRTTIRMKPELARRAKAYARKTDRTFTELVEIALADLLGRETSNPAKLPEITVVYGTNQISTEQLKRDIEQMNLEDDLRQIELGGKIDPVA